MAATKARQKVVSLHLVEKKGNEEVVDFLELMLEEARTGILTGISGTFEMISKKGIFCYGTCGERPSCTLTQLERLADHFRY